MRFGRELCESLGVGAGRLNLTRGKGGTASLTLESRRERIFPNVLGVLPPTGEPHMRTRAFVDLSSGAA